MRVEAYEPRKHYPQIYKWWRARRDFPLDLEMLGKQGAVVYEGEQALAVTWLYITDCKLVQLGWSLTNPEAPVKQRAEALKLAIKSLIDLAKSLGYKRVITFSSSGGLTREFEAQGFTRLIAHDVLVRAI